MPEESHTRRQTAEGEAVRAAIASSEPQVIAALARSFLLVGDVSDAEAAVARLRSLDPQAEEIPLLSALLSASRGQYDEALPELEKAVEKRPDDDLVRRLATKAYVEAALDDYGRSEYARARDGLLKALEISPSDVDALRWLGDTERMLGNVERALKSLSEALAEVDAGSGDASLRPWILANRGRAQRLGGNMDAAERDLLDALHADESLSWAHAELGEVYRLAGRLQQALASLQRATELDPQDAWARASLAATYQALGKHSTALSILDEVVAQQPDYAFAVVRRADVLLELDEVAAALEDARRATELDPNIVDPWIIAAFARELLGGRVEQSEADYRRALELEPSWLFSLLRLSEIELYHGHEAAAIDLWERLVRDADRDDDMDMQDSGWALMRLRRYDEAATALARVAAADTYSSSSWFDLALNSLVAGDTEISVAQYRDAVQRTYSLVDLGRRKAHLRVATFDLDWVVAHPRREIQPDAVAQVKDVLERARSRVRREEERRAVSNTQGVSMRGAPRQ